MKFKLMKYDDILVYEPIADKLKVSLIARGLTEKEGFMTAYKNLGENLNEFWNKKRNSFITRTLAAYNMNPTKRRFISLVFWAYLPVDEISIKINQQILDMIYKTKTI